VQIKQLKKSMGIDVNPSYEHKKVPIKVLYRVFLCPESSLCYVKQEAKQFIFGDGKLNNGVGNDKKR